MILRRVSAFFGGVLALLLSVTAVGWACTATHQGSTYFCAGGTCGAAFQISHWSAGANVTQVLKGGVASVTYTLYYITGTSQGDACHTTPTGNFGALTTDIVGDANRTINTAGLTWGNYTACPTYQQDPNGDSTNHKNFTIP